ncbi:MAG TPA: CopG family transcriptional regulator [Thermoanaerobaculia bacterium]|jgi:predicted transcriptional regulator|nr:CopG family transcriptional regulator [Thermoanaerobaculia bacterium]
MSQLAIYLDDDTSRLLDEAAEREGVSRSAWVRQAVQSRLRNRLPDSFFAVLGTWEDGRDPEEILRDIRQEIPQKHREPLD